MKAREQALPTGLNIKGYNMASANDMKAAQATYQGFVGMIKYAVPVIVVLVAFVIYLIH